MRYSFLCFFFTAHQHKSPIAFSTTAHFRRDDKSMENDDNRHKEGTLLAPYRHTTLFPPLPCVNKCLFFNHLKINGRRKILHSVHHAVCKVDAYTWEAFRPTQRESPGVLLVSSSCAQQHHISSTRGRDRNSILYCRVIVACFGALCEGGQTVTKFSRAGGGGVASCESITPKMSNIPSIEPTKLTFSSLRPSHPFNVEGLCGWGEYTVETHGILFLFLLHFPRGHREACM